MQKLKGMLVRTMVVAAIVLVGFMLSLSVSNVAQASVHSCRADPIIILSDGTQIQMTVAMQTSFANVRSIVYTLHAPVGTTISKIIYTGSSLAGKEKVNFYADTAAGQYNTDTLVTTSSSSVYMTATTSSGGVSGSASGYEEQHLIVSLAR